MRRWLYLYFHRVTRQFDGRSDRPVPRSMSDPTQGVRKHGESIFAKEEDNLAEKTLGRRARQEAGTEGRQEGFAQVHGESSGTQDQGARHTREGEGQAGQDGCQEGSHGSTDPEGREGPGDQARSGRPPDDARRAERHAEPIWLWPRPLVSHHTLGHHDRARAFRRDAIRRPGQASAGDRNLGAGLDVIRWRQG